MILIKIGGGIQINWKYIAEDISSLVKLGEEVIVVHGANGQVQNLSESLGLEQKFITSPSGHVSRYTDEKTMDILTMVYSGLVNKKIVARLQSFGVNAIGLTGADGRIWQGKRKENILSLEKGKTKLIKDSLTGFVTNINHNLLNLLLEKDFVPVLTIPAITDKGELINVDNDRAIAIMVRDMKIKTLVSLFEAPGLLKDVLDDKSVIKNISKENLDKYLEENQGRMKKKLLGLQESFNNGLEVAYFGDGRIKNPITRAMKGEGTKIE